MASKLVPNNVKTLLWVDIDLYYIITYKLDRGVMTMSLFTPMINVKKYIYQTYSHLMSAAALKIWTWAFPTIFDKVV